MTSDDEKKNTIFVQSMPSRRKSPALCRSRTKKSRCLKTKSGKRSSCDFDSTKSPRCRPKKKGSRKKSNKKVEVNLRKEFKKWNNSFTFDVSNGIYEVFQHDFKYEEFDFEHYDTMFCVKKLL